ncbi:MAG TPA: periplasmic heavy metal sensor [Candidatus Sulfotelmatobacter sp.]|nr:periplasmic heavy metal sensor [Candidatus Sulfotelmatobacter sp.]
MSDIGTGATGAAPQRNRRGARILLVASLAVNLLLIGFLVGHMLHPPWHERGGPLTIEHITGALPPEVRDAVRASLRDRRPQIAERMAAVRQARADVRAAIEAEPFDAQRLQTAFATLRDRSQAVQEDVAAAVVEAISKLPPDARRELSR